jgi:RNA polymerase sigma factor (sigma-70 family)
MPDANDMDLVREYAARNSEPAFETLVRRHVSLVYSVALRQVGNPVQAEEITQAVFLILARKAARLRPDTVLAAWLHETARFASASFLRGESRRRRREQEAYMQSKLQESSADPAWEQLAPLLDEAIGQLGKADRNAVVLRFFQNKSAREIAAALNVHESAAQKRLNRAVEKLRAYFLKRGVTVSAGALTGALSVNSVHGAPAHLAASVMAVSAKGTAVSSSTLTLIQGALKIMAWTKAKTAAVAVTAVILAAGTTTVVIQYQHHRATRNDVSRAAWVFSGYDDPKSAVLTFLYAIRQADGEQILAGCTPELQQNFQQNFGKQAQAKGKTLSEFLADELPARLKSTTGIRILSQLPVAADRIEFRVLALGERAPLGGKGEHQITVRKIGDEWKVDQVFTGSPFQ